MPVPVTIRDVDVTRRSGPRRQGDSIWSDEADCKERRGGVAACAGWSYSRTSIEDAPRTETYFRVPDNQLILLALLRPMAPLYPPHLPPLLLTTVALLLARSSAFDELGSFARTVSDHAKLQGSACPLTGVKPSMPAEALPMCRQFDESSCCSRCARFGGVRSWRDGGMAGWRDGGVAGWRGGRAGGCVVVVWTGCYLRRPVRVVLGTRLRLADEARRLESTFRVTA